jgi:hypothetical protein
MMMMMMMMIYENTILVKDDGYRDCDVYVDSNIKLNLIQIICFRYIYVSIQHTYRAVVSCEILWRWF